MTEEIPDDIVEFCDEATRGGFVAKRISCQIDRQFYNDDDTFRGTWWKGRWMAVFELGNNGLSDLHTALQKKFPEARPIGGENDEILISLRGLTTEEIELYLLSE